MVDTFSVTIMKGLHKCAASKTSSHNLPLSESNPDWAPALDQGGQGQETVHMLAPVQLCNLANVRVVTSEVVAQLECVV